MLTTHAPLRNLLAELAMVGLALFASSAQGQIKQAPKGVFCSCPPTNGLSHSVLPEVASLPYVDGTLLRIGWATIEPTQGQYDWTVLDAELARAELYDTDVALSVVLGSQTPPWIESLGAEVFEYDRFGSTEQLVVPWDPILLDNLTAMIDKLGERYDSNSRIKLVHMTHSTANGFEMQLGGSLTDWQAIGYTTQRHVDSWRTVLDAYNDAFPLTPLDLDIHPVLQSDDVAIQVVDYSYSTIGNRFGVLAAWWTMHNADDVYQGMNTILADAACDAFAAVQVARSETVHGADIFGDNGLEGTLYHALDANIGYLEIWNSDLLNPELQPMIQTFAADLAAATGCTAICLADVNGDGELSPTDFSAWIGAFNNSLPTCDQNGDGECTPTDFSAWIGNYNAGC